MNKIIKMTIALLLVALTVYGPMMAMASGSAVEPGAVKVGMLGPFTGPAASIGQEMLNWARLAVDQFNGAGGIAGTAVELVEEDTELDAAKAAIAAERLAADEAIYGVIGPASSQAVISTAEIFEENNLVSLSTSATRADLTEQGRKTFFRIVPRDDVQAPTDAIFIAERLEAQKVYILDDQSIYSVGLADDTQAKLEELGLEIIGRESISQEDTDFSALLTRVKAKAPDVLFLPIQFASQGAQIAKQMQELGLEATIVGSDGQFSTVDFIEGAEGATEGAYVSIFAPDVHYIPEAAEVVAVYEAEYGEFTSYGPPVYEAMNILLEAMARAYEADGQLTREGVLREVAATEDRLGIMGFPVSFDEKGDVLNASFFIFEVVGDHFELVKTVPPE
ncbi:MAG: branched-chain amino acid ABC transporter substrate-binding protein [Anaerolineae bacterium]